MYGLISTSKALLAAETPYCVVSRENNEKDNGSSQAVCSIKRPWALYDQELMLREIELAMHFLLH